MSRLAAVIAAVVAAAPSGARASCTSYPELCGLHVTSTIEQADLDHAIDVVLVGDGFTTVDSWRSKANSAIDIFKGHTTANVYGAVPEVYNFHIVDVISDTTDVGDDDLTDTALGMNVSGATISAVGSRVSTAAMNAPDVDVTIAIANSESGRANASLPAQLASGGRVRLASLSPITHEMGHAAIGLADEYVESSKCSTPPQPRHLYRRANVTADPTCIKFSTTPGADCVQGGYYCSTGVWRSASDCLMRSAGDTATCPVCERTVREVLAQKRTGTDFAEPWGVIATPAAGATVSGVLSMGAYVFDDYFTPVTVAFVIDGAYVGSAVTETSVATLEIDTRKLTDGEHTATIFVDDAAGFTMPSVTVPFVVANADSTGELTVTLTRPLDGDTVSGPTAVVGTIEGSGTAVLAVAYVDGFPLAVRAGSDLKSVYLEWDTTSLSPGDYDLDLRVRDPADNETTSGAITVTVEAATTCPGGSGLGPEQGPSCVYLFWPRAWDPVGPLFDVYYVINSIPPPAMVDLLLDGNVVMPSVLPAFDGGSDTTRALIDASGWALGAHAIEVRVDNGSLESTSTPTPIVRIDPGAVPVAYVLLPSAGVAVAVRGAVDVTLAAYDDVGVTDLSLVVDGIDAGPVSTNPGTFAWDTTLESEGGHQLVARATDGDSNIGWSESLHVVVDNSPPVVTLVEPADGAVVPPGVVVVSSNASDAVSVIGRRELWVDGVAVSQGGASGTLFANLGPGPHSLFVRVFDRAGNQADSQTVNVTAEHCDISGCEDNDSCTSDTCSPLGRCIHVRTPGCCEDAGDCDDNDDCTVDACDGTCSHTPVTDCCNFGYACDDGVAETQDICSGPGGTCSNPDHPRCNLAAECDDSHGCTVDACILAPQGLCANNWTLNCCVGDPDCDNGNPCTLDACNGGTCTRTPVEGCCVSGTECDDGEVCTYDICSNNACSNPPRPTCCEGDPDCVTYNPCATVSCDLDSNYCVEELTEGCCTFDFECDDRDVCSADFCNNGICDAISGGICCTVPADCVDSDPCTVEECDLDGFCQRPRIPGCCVDAVDCDEGDPCIIYSCVDNACQEETASDCCHDDDECDEGDPCIIYSCVENVCQEEAASDCCHDDDSECEDGDPCTTNTCVDNVCQEEAASDCCHDDGECDGGDPCIIYTCVDNACQEEAASDCCHGESCDDDPGTGVLGGCGCGFAGSGRLGLAAMVVAGLALRRRRRRARGGHQRHDL